MEKLLYFISGLPRSGSNLLSHILNQNPLMHIEVAGNLLNHLKLIHNNWNSLEYLNTNKRIDCKKNILKSIVREYYSTDKPIIIDRDLNWISNLSFMEAILDKKIKIIVCVRNPAEIVASYEKFRSKNPYILLPVDYEVPISTIETRADYYANPKGILGLNHYSLSEKIETGHLDRFLFIDYNRFINNPVLHLKKIYEFLNLDYFEHNLEKIESITTHLNKDSQIFFEIEKNLQRKFFNPVHYLGLDLYEKYNTGIFWNQWI